MDISNFLGFTNFAQNLFVAQLFTQPIDTVSFGIAMVSFVQAVFVHGVLLIITSMFVRI